MAKIDSLIGKTIVGYRYGIAPESGFSFNTRERIAEPGVSMAQVGFGKEIQSFAVSAQSNKRYYYVGQISGEGSDDEICLVNVKRITRNEYLNLRKGKDMVSISNEIVNAIADRKTRLMNMGYNYSEEEIENYRKKYTK